MKLVPSIALLAVFLLVADSVAPSQAWGWINLSKDDEKPIEKKAELKVEPDTMVKDEEQLPEHPDDESILDKDDIEDIPLKTSLSTGEIQSYNDDKPKFEIPEDEFGPSSIPVISHLPPQEPNQPEVRGVQPNNTYQMGYPYDRTPQQSEFVDGAAHPTESREIDPRFLNRQPRECQENQYLCKKATPSQEHVRCIPNEWKCNGVRDCELNDDEDGCAINVHRVQPNGCNLQYQYTCYGTGVQGIPAQCIDSSKLCDGTYDCSYGDDESQDRCAAFGNRRQAEAQPEPQQDNRRVEQAPQYNPRPAPQPEQRPVQSQVDVQPQPQYQHQPQPQPQCNGLSEDYVKRLEWTDRCIRTCMSRSPNNGN